MTSHSSRLPAIALLITVAAFVAGLSFSPVTAQSVPEWDSGSVRATTSASGYVTVSHDLDSVPDHAIVTTRSPISGPAIPWFVGADSYTATTFRVRFLQHTSSGLTPYASKVVEFTWSARKKPSGPTTTTVAPTTTETTVSPTTTTEPAECAGPLTITSGGTYTGCWESTASGTPAVTVATTEPVTIDGGQIRHQGLGISAPGDGTKLTVTDTVIAARPSASGSQRAMRLLHPDSLVVEHNLLVDGAGIYVLADNQTVSPLRVRYNEVRNIGRNPQPELVQFFQTDKVVAPGAEVAWNKVTNVFGQSGVEDVVSLYKTNGSAASPFDVHHNLIDGAYPRTAGGGYSGGGIMLGDDGGTFANAHHNRVLSTTNYGIAISGGSDHLISGNRIVGDRRASDGTAITASNIGLYIWNQYAAPWARNAAADNVVGWLRGDGQRNDWWFPDCDPADACFDNQLLASPIDAAKEQAERDAWAAEVAAAGLTIGPRP